MPTIFETTDAGLWDNTIYTMEPGDTFVGESEFPFGDSDSVRVNLVAGVTYTFTMTSTSDNWAHDFVLQLGAPEEFPIVETFGTDSDPAVITFTATETGTLFLTTRDQTIDVNESPYQITMTSSGTPAPTGPTDGDDDLTGASNSDALDLMDGNDSFAAGGGSDDISGGEGNDSILGESGKDTLVGGMGDDYLDGGSGSDVLAGEEGNDTLLGGLSNDTLRGGEDNDSLDGGKGNDALFGDAGDDTLMGGKGNDTLEGGAGADVFVYEKRSNNDTITDFEDGTDLIDMTASGAWDISQLNLSQNGDDVVIDFSGAHSITLEDVLLGDLSNDDFILADEPEPAPPSTSSDTFIGDNTAQSYDGGAGSDVINGLGGNDTLGGGTGADTIDGGSGRDLVSGGTGNDNLNGGGGGDTIDGGAGDDIIAGGGGSDLITGAGGDDVIIGGSGSDTINGGDGDDTIDGGTGNDLMTGNAGADVFVFATGHRDDTVTDFEDGVDLFDITGLDFGLQNFIVSNTVTIAAGDSFSFDNDTDSITILNSSSTDITLNGADYIWDNIFVVG